jgi:hypothetical protein
MFLRVILCFLGVGSFALINRPGMGGLASFSIVVVGWAILDRLDDLIALGRAAPLDTADALRRPAKKGE